jgi:hypothetical protein
MSLLLATLLPGLLLIALGAPLLLNHSGFAAMLKAFPRSPTATVVFFGSGAAWFLYNVWHLSPADFGDFRKPLCVGFAVIALASFKYVPDFLAVRGVCTLMLVAAGPLLRAAYMEYQFPRRLFMVTLVYVGIALAIWLGAQPWRMRDFIGWLFVRPGRSRSVGAALTVYGLLLAGVAFTY